MKKNSFQKKQGQTQLLMVMALSLAMMTASIYMLENTQRVKSQQLTINWQSEMRTAIEVGIKLASNLYRIESSCDPVVLAEKLGRVNPDGSISQKPTQSQLQVNLNSRFYTVSFGRVSRMPWEGSDTDPSLSWNKGTTQDAIVEVWATRPGSNFTLIQQAVLINNCNYLCSDPDGEVCVTRTNRGIAYGKITSPSNYPMSSAQYTFGCGGSANRKLGMLKQYDPGTTNLPLEVDTRDLMILKNYLRSGDLQGSTDVIMNGDTNYISCADYNQDGVVNEVDLGVMEKYLRGYLFWTRTRGFSQ